MKVNEIFYENIPILLHQAENAVLQAELNSIKVELSDTKTVLKEIASKVATRGGWSLEGGGRGQDVLQSQVEGLVLSERRMEERMKSMRKEVEEVRRDMVAVKTGSNWEQDGYRRPGKSGVEGGGGGGVAIRV